ncbi:MAG TPA: hypothetical protein ENJ95_14980 [Bacteroidetes bacterium]|nr:hypothetical protein [Bacteroidota bacterium]
MLAIPTKKICAQPGILIKTKQENKNRVYAYWGWNRGYFTDSDIHFSGNGYDFTLKGVVAKDRQSEFSFATYFGPTKFTIPQVNYGIGYYLKNNCILTLGLDHMKYVVQRPQEVTISGNIDGSNLPYRGTYKGEHITLKDNLLKLEHTNGLNYLSAGIMRTDNLFKNIKTLKNKLELNLMEGIGAGALIPKTDVTLLSQPRNDQYHLSGFGLSANVGLQIVSFKHFFIRGELKTGYINLTSFVASPESGGKGSQHFFFLQPSGQFGWAFYLKRR